jgi:hypothetical protein
MTFAEWVRRQTVDTDRRVIGVDVSAFVRLARAKKEPAV